MAEVMALPVGISPGADRDQRPDVAVEEANQWWDKFLRTPAGIAFLIVGVAITSIVMWRVTAFHGRNPYLTGRDVWLSFEPPGIFHTRENVPGIDFQIPDGWRATPARTATWRTASANDEDNRLRVSFAITHESPPASFARLDETIECRSGPVDVFRAEVTRMETRYVEYRFVGKGFGLATSMPAADESELKPILWNIARSIRVRRAP